MHLLIEINVYIETNYAGLEKDFQYKEVPNEG